MQTPGMNTDQMIYTVQCTMALEYLTLAFAGIIMTCVITHFIQGALGSTESLYSLFGKQFNPMGIIKFIRVFIFLYSLILFVLWIQLGLENLNYFVLFRRIIYYSYTLISGLLSSTVYNYFLSTIVQKLTVKYEEEGQEIPESLKFLTLFRDIFTRSYAYAAAISMLLKVVANDYLSSFIIPWQIISNVAIHYSSTVLTFYSVYKTFPKYLKRFSKHLSREKHTTKNRLISGEEKPNHISVAPTVMVNK